MALSQTEVIRKRPEARRHRYLPKPLDAAMWAGAAFSVWIFGLLRTLALTGTIAWAMGPVALGIALGAAISLAVLYAYWVVGHKRLTNEWLWPLLPLLTPVWLLFVRTPQPWRGPVLLIGSVLLSLLIIISLRSRRFHRSHWVGWTLAVLLPLALYLLDVSPYVGRADTFEFQVVAPTLGVAHPSGYPLYTLIGKFFSLIPLGTVAWRVNLSSAVFGALASGFLFLTLTEREEGNGIELALSWLVALVASWALAFSPTLWSRAIEAEVYALNACFVAFALWLAVNWRQGGWSTSLALPAFGLLIGLALASHVTLGALGLLALVMLLTTRPSPQVRILLLAGMLGLLGLALYLYIPLRWPAVTGGERMSLAHFWRFVTNAESGGALHPKALIEDPSRWKLVGLLFKRQVGIPGLLLATVGFVALCFQAWNLALGTLLMFAAWVWFNLSFYVADPDYSAFLIPAHVVLLFWLGTGMRAFARKLSRWIPVLALLGVVGVALLPMWQLWKTGPTLDTRTQGYTDEMWARYALRQPLVEGSAILADSEKFPPLYYLQQVEGTRSDLELVTLFNEAQYRAALDARLAEGQTVYLARYLPGLDAYGVGAVGPLVRVAPNPAEGTGDKSAIARWDGMLALLSDDIELDPLGRRMHHLHLTWCAEAELDLDLEIRVRLVDPDGDAVIWTSEGRRPVGGYTTTQAWAEGDVVSDYVPLAWPAWVPPRSYRLDVGVFQRFGPGLSIEEGGHPWFDVGSIEIPTHFDLAPSSSVVPTLDSRSLSRGVYGGEIWLSDVSVPGEVAAGGSMTLDATWMCANRDPTGIPWMQWTSLEDGAIAQNVPLRPIGYENPTDFCAIMGTDAVPVRYRIPIPRDSGRYQIELGWGTEPTARCRWLGRRRDACSIGTVNVLPGGKGLANYDNRILLLDAEVNAEGIPAGGPLQVQLQWRALRAMQKDYTVFVQVLGPDGKLYGQADSWPVQGARPTHGWGAGEEIRDTYEIYVDTDRPSGDYQVIVGWYLLADMSRLSVLDPGGQVVGDHVVVGSFTLP